MTRMKLRLEFLFTDLTKHFGNYLVSLHSRFLLMDMGGGVLRGALNSSVL